MKPSERIMEIAERHCSEREKEGQALTGVTDLKDAIDAIIDYLDEQHESKT